MDFKKCSRLGCKNDDCNYHVCSIGNICKSCQKNLREYLISKYSNYIVDNNYFPEKILLKEMEFFMTNNLKK
jgi:hypothetical protein